MNDSDVILPYEKLHESQDAREERMVQNERIQAREEAKALISTYLKDVSYGIESALKIDFSVPEKQKSLKDLNVTQNSIFERLIV